jgi:hypothetical protein
VTPDEAGRGPGLPVRSGADIHLADAFALPGCPLCRERERTAAAFVEAILAESVNDVGFRLALDAARGFCGPHARVILDADRRRAGSLGAAILLRATLRIRLAELEAAHGHRGRTRAKRMEAVARAPACPVCARIATTDRTLVDSVIRLVSDSAWSAAAGSAPFCLEHLVALAVQGSNAPAWPAIEAAQLARLRDLDEALAGYAHASSQDRRHLLTDAQRASVDAAADVLAGPVPAPAGTHRRHRSP